VNVFRSQFDFISFLAEHPKTKEALLTLTSGTYDIRARKAVTQVSVSKLVDVFGLNVPSAAKEKVSSWLADLTKMKSTDFFDARTHKGFLIKHLNNRQRRLPPSERDGSGAKR
jgi:hypothetical protein